MVEKIGCAPTFPECKSGVLTSYTISPYFLFHFSILSNNSSNVILDFLYFEEFLLCCINSQLAGCDIILGSILFIKPSYTEYMWSLAEHEGLEPPRPYGRLISNQLQYHCANAPMAGRTGFEPVIPCGMSVFKTDVLSLSTIYPWLPLPDSNGNA